VPTHHSKKPCKAGIKLARFIASLAAEVFEKEIAQGLSSWTPKARAREKAVRKLINTLFVDEVGTKLSAIGPATPLNCRFRQKPWQPS
jgi:hypothetical protein